MAPNILVCSSNYDDDPIPACLSAISFFLILLWIVDWCGLRT